MEEITFLARQILLGRECNNCSYRLNPKVIREEDPQSFCELQEYEQDTICIHHTTEDEMEIITGKKADDRSYELEEKIEWL